MKVALVHDWLTGMRGGEQCLAKFLELFPEADVHTMVYVPEKFDAPISSVHVVTSRFGKLPRITKYYRHLLPLYPQVSKEISRGLKGYDLVVSISHAWAKNIEVEAPHLCYCLTPMRYIWDHFDTYFAGKAIEPFARTVAPYLRRWDVAGEKGVDSFVAISEYIRDRISRVYSRDSQVVFPPVDQDWLSVGSSEPSRQKDSFLVVNALVPYKNTRPIIEAFNKLGAPLEIVGTGPELAGLKRIAKPNISFLGSLGRKQLAIKYRNARALVFGAREDFGMNVVEAQAAGTPVIALGQGGALETVVPFSNQAPSGLKPSGVFFSEPTVEDICAAVDSFQEIEGRLSKKACLDNARRFSPEIFEQGVISALGKLGFDSLEPKVALGKESSFARSALGTA